MSICVVCGKEFTPPSHNGRKTCSDECFGKYMSILRRRNAAERAKQPKKKRIETCVICGKEFSPPHKYKRKTCSDECFRKYKSVVSKRSRIGVEELKPREKKYLNTCVICGEEFYASKRAVKTCSDECYKKFKSQLQTGTSYKWSAEARKKVSVQRKGNKSINLLYTEYARKANSVMLENPRNQMGPQNKFSKEWILVSPEGEIVQVINIMDWIRQHIQEYFGMEPTPKNVHRVTNRFVDTKRLLHGKRPIEDGNPKIIKSCNGWGLLDWSDEPKPVDIDDMKTQQ